MQFPNTIERLLNRNPEFKRNAWIELSPGRLLAMPVIILAIFFMVLANTEHDVLHAIALAGTSLYFVLVFLGGSKLAIDSVIDEINGRTCIQQQMTPLSAGAMTIGKLFGSTIYAWYGGLMALTVGSIAQAYDYGTTVGVVSLNK
jgi:hypothetical protein